MVKKNPLEPINCPRCDVVNPSKASYCYECGHALDRTQAMKDDENKKVAINEAIEFMMKMSNNPKLMEKFRQFEEGTK